MKQISLLIFLSCISSTTIFSSEKKEQNSNTQQDPHLKEYVEGWKNAFDYEQKKKENINILNENLEKQDDFFSKIQHPQEIEKKHQREIAQLKEYYANEIALHEAKITALMLDREQKDAEINTLKSNKQS